jgi:hypothetical protein
MDEGTSVYSALTIVGWHSLRIRIRIQYSHSVVAVLGLGICNGHTGSGYGRRG